MTHRGSTNATEVFYDKIMKDVKENMRPFFIDEGVSEQVLNRLFTVKIPPPVIFHQTWEKKLRDSGVIRNPIVHEHYPVSCFPFHLYRALPSTPHISTTDEPSNQDHYQLLLQK